MVRETLDAGSKHALMAVTPGNGVAFQWRAATNGGSTNRNTTGRVAPYWVRLVRSGSLLTGYASPDGVTWTLVGAGAAAAAGVVLWRAGAFDRTEPGTEFVFTGPSAAVYRF